VTQNNQQFDGRFISVLTSSVAMITKLNADWDEYKASRNKVNIAFYYMQAFVLPVNRAI
jgi:hypothetical protein